MEPSLSWPQLEPAVQEALAALLRARAQEGAALASELRQRAARLDQIAVELGEQTRGIPARAARRLQERIEAALAGSAAAGALDPGRLAQEVAVLADRLDVSEELARLEVHRKRLHELLANGGQPPAPAREGIAREEIAREEIGRPLEFLLQELGREFNTIGSKSQDADVSALVIAGKAELEKIREQAQNIE